MKSKFRISALATLVLTVFACASANRRPGPPATQLAEVANDDVVATFFDDDFSKTTGGYSYSYGGNTHTKIARSSSNDGGSMLVTYLADDYSGVNVSMGTGKLLDLSPYRKTGSVTFLIQGGPAAEKFMIGLMDVHADGKKVQTKVNGDSYAVVKEGTWTRCTIPLKAFADDGVYWDAAQGREISAKMDWSRINDFRISINRGENKVAPGQPVMFYLDQIQLSKTAKGVEDPDAYWDAFKSEAPPVLVTDFTRWKDGWQTQHGKSAEIAAAVVAPPKNAPEAAKGQALKVDFKPGDWYDAFIQPATATGMIADWSKHYAATVWLYTDKPYQSFDFVILDRDHEMFWTKLGAARGWNQILIPFRAFSKFPYFQPPEAKPNNKLDLDGIFQFGIKPGGEVPGTLYLANLQLTNAREIVKVKAPAELPAIFQGDLTKVVQKIPDIYGINVGKWVPDLLDTASLAPEKQLALGVVRYPGGLLSDEEDWQKTLKAKDSNIDTDEFLDWCAKSGCKPMFTVNVGDGTPELAAAWVKYVNQTRKGPKVQLWEVGNEIYGDWHRYYARWGKDGGVAYGKAVRAFVKAMKAVDPTIKVSAVWMLSGPWNKAVFKEAGDAVDAVSVHHYAQNWGSESDPGLLAVSSEAGTLMSSVKKQLDELGVKGKPCEIWLTEWNSVDANPGPQILQHVNGLFVADYLAHLAASPIQIANLWALYNGRDKRMGDYSLLAPKGDPQEYNFRRPSYWGFEMVSNTLTGTLLQAKTDQESLSGFLAKRADGKPALVFVNKNFDTDYKTTLKVLGLKGEATVEVLTSDGSGGLASAAPTGKLHPSTGPKSRKVSLADGSTLMVPKASIVTVRF
ncbi:MAG TPA: carbohydrate binding domain-containing protein [Polyangiaceae bacterium]|nr:carbohydrate binding domain-containing protein [Polyangiaceae bacterium]